MEPLSEDVGGWGARGNAAGGDGGVEKGPFTWDVHTAAAVIRGKTKH